MNILLVTNTFTPHVGGVARSVAAFSAEYRRLGHGVMIVAPEFDGQPKHEDGIYRVSALQHFNASDFSVALPLHPGLGDAVDAFGPDVVHSQHPFLLGMTALRLARHRQRPLVFTHHTLYEQYTHYVPGDSPLMKRYVIELSTRYANMSDLVFAPSESIRALLERRGVERRIEVVPTGVHPERFSDGDGPGLRRRLDIPEDAFVAGHLGRLAFEKNLEFLARALVAFLEADGRAHVLIVGVGPAESALRQTFADAGMTERLHLLGVLARRPLADAMHAMDVFAFASLSETQGMVLTEAMAAGLPVVALDASGVRDVVVDGRNGYLLNAVEPQAFGAALSRVAALDDATRQKLRRGALETASAFSMESSAAKALTCFDNVRPKPAALMPMHRRRWEEAVRALRTEWNIVKSLAAAGEAALHDDEARTGERAGRPTDR